MKTKLSGGILEQIEDNARKSGLDYGKAVVYVSYEGQSRDYYYFDGERFSFVCSLPFGAGSIDLSRMNYNSELIKLEKALAECGNKSYEAKDFLVAPVFKMYSWHNSRASEELDNCSYYRRLAFGRDENGEKLINRYFLFCFNKSRLAHEYHRGSAKAYFDYYVSLSEKTNN